MASLWDYISGLFRGAPSSPAAADPNASIYGQPVGVANLPAALPQQQPAPAAPDLKLTGSYFDPSQVRLPGMSGGSVAASLPQRAPEPPPSAAPASTAPFGSAAANGPPPIDPASLPQAPVMPKSGHLGNVLDDLFLGGAIRRARESEYAEQSKNYNDALSRAVARRNMGLIADLPQQVQAAAAMSPDKTGEALASDYAFHALNEGQTARYGNGQTYTAPKTGISNNRAFTQTPSGFSVTGDVGPKFNADGVDETGIYPQANFNKPAPIDSTVFNSGGTFLPGGGAAALPQLPQSGAPAPAGGQGGAPPRGVRNNNPGNVRALPNGQQWQGQTGVDDQGYATFDTPQSGIRATLTNLHSYGQLHGVNTVQGVADRWAPASGGNDPKAYGAFVAQRLGVKPTDKIDLNDSKTLGGVAQAIFDFENGGGGTGQPAPSPVGPAPRSVAGLPQKGAAPTGQASLKGGNFIRQLTPQEVVAHGYAPGSIVLQKPNGDLETKTGGTAWTPADVREVRKAAMDSPDYREAQASLQAYYALTKNVGALTGPAAYNILDTWIRTINPGASAKQGNIEAAMLEMGVPAEVVGMVQHLKGQGKLPLDIQQKILDGVLPFVQGHWDHANALNQSNADAAQRHGYDPRDITLPLEGRPERFVIPGQGDAGPVRLDPKTADADFARLPKGAQFIGPDGKLRTKP